MKGVRGGVGQGVGTVKFNQRRSKSRPADRQKAHLTYPLPLPHSKYLCLKHFDVISHLCWDFYGIFLWIGFDGRHVCRFTLDVVMFLRVNWC